MAGGLTPFASPRSIMVIRTVGGKDEVFRSIIKMWLRANLGAESHLVAGRCGGSALTQRKNREFMGTRTWVGLAIIVSLWAANLADAADWSLVPSVTQRIEYNSNFNTTPTGKLERLYFYH